MKRILVRDEVCSGCRACAVACMVRHEVSFGTAAARVWVSKIEHLGLDQPRVCQLCEPALCVEACATQALFKAETSGAILLRSGDCISCAACVEACPFGAVALHPTTGLALICDLCDGDPACVKRCVTGAIRYAEPVPVELGV